MAWTPQGGPGPWGRGNMGPQPPDLEELLRQGQEQFKRYVPGGFRSGRGVVLAILAVFVVWLATGFYRVQPAEQGVVMLFGKWVQTTQPGLNWFFPRPIGEIYTPNVEAINRVEVGFRGADESGRVMAGARDVPGEGLILTSDQNISDVDFTVFWKIKDAGQFLFNIRNPEATVKTVAESAMREVVGQTKLQQALTEGRALIEQRTRTLMQNILDSYGAGVLVNDVRLLKVDAPPPVIDAFNEVQRARQDKDRAQNEAEAYRNRVVPTARGEAARILQEAQAYRDRLVTEAQGEAKRFVDVYAAYAQAKDVTTRRMYLETLEEILRGTNKVIIESGAGGTGVVPYLPLPELQRRPRRAEAGPSPAAPAPAASAVQIPVQRNPR